MEIFKQTNFDFLKYKWPFILASIALSVTGIISLVVHGGPKYGIEFKGGMLMTVKFQSAPPIEQIRSTLSGVLSSPPTVQTFENGSNEVEIGTEGTDDASLGKNRQLVLDTLARTFGQPNNGKLDLNNASGISLANRLRDALNRASQPLADQQINDLAAAIVAWRDQHGGLLRNLSEVNGVTGMSPTLANVLSQETYLAPYTAARNIEIVGPKVGADLRRQALNATLLALGGMLVYIWFRFEWIYGVGAVLACFHDTLITIGLFSILDREISLTVIAALLTLVGYSMNDTIVIFDRIRENLRMGRKDSLENVINLSVNQTLSRTVMTSGLTFLAVLAIFLFGGPVLHGFSLALVIGIIIGTYSSVFVASPIVLGWHNWYDKRNRKAPVAVPAAAPKAPAASGKAGGKAKVAR
jgi:preprotein translocase subunit SecF